MADCDVCGAVNVKKSDCVQLYTAKLIKREYSKSQVGSRKTTANYDHFRPVSVTACSKHKRELTKQRILPGVIVFVLLVIPILFLLKLVPGIGSSLAYQLPIALLITGMLTQQIIQVLVRYDNYLALLMTIKEKRAGSDREYLTERKYQRYTGQGRSVAQK